MTYGNAHNWLVLAGIAFAGAAIRVYFVARHKGHASPLPAIAGVAALAVVAFAIAPASRSTVTSTATPAEEFAHVSTIVQARCAVCHAPSPTQPGFAAAPKGVMLDTPDRIAAQSVQINQQVSSRVMPLANLTGMTDAERETITQWFAHGALTK
jgi:uncharacterized membrane protein